MLSHSQTRSSDAYCDDTLKLLHPTCAPARASPVNLLLLATLLGPGCDTDEGGDAAPELPPIATLQADLSGIESAPLAAKQASPTTTGNYSHFANAWLRVNVLRLYAAGIVLIPAAVMAAALSQQPTFEAGAWTWRVNAANADATLRVAGTRATGFSATLSLLS